MLGRIARFTESCYSYKAPAVNSITSYISYDDDGDGGFDNDGGDDDGDYNYNLSYSHACIWFNLHLIHIIHILTLVFILVLSFILLRFWRYTYIYIGIYTWHFFIRALRTWDKRDCKIFAGWASRFTLSVSDVDSTDTPGYSLHFKKNEHRTPSQSVTRPNFRAVGSTLDGCHQDSKDSQTEQRRPETCRGGCVREVNWESFTAWFSFDVDL